MKYNILSNLIVEKYIISTYKKPCLSSQGYFCDENSWKICVKETGTTVYTYKGKEAVCDKNSIIIIPAGVEHEWNNTVMGDYSHVSFKSSATYDDIICVKCDNNEKILEKIRRLNDMHFITDQFSQIKCIKEVYEIILEIISFAKREPLSSVHRKKLEPIKNYIDENYYISHSNDDLAERAGMSVSHFRKIFTSLYGISPIHYVHKVRVEKSKLLLFSNEKISHIATNVGYQDIYDFSRAFKRVEGMSPSKYKTLFFDGY